MRKGSVDAAESLTGELDRGLPLIIKQPFSNARGVAEKCGILFDLSLAKQNINMF